jgi:lipopolysaccharide export system permease protein
MKLLDRYIARQYLLNIGALLLILACFVVAIDVSLNLARYYKTAVDVSQTSGEADTGLRRVLITLVLVADLWWPRLLSLFAFLNGLVLIGAMGFTVTQLVRHRELVAVLTSGQSLFRVARPLILVALLMTGVQVLDQEMVIPRIAPLLTREPGDAGKRQLGATRVPPTVDAKGRVWYAGSFDADAGAMTDVSIWERDERALPIRRIHADKAQWQDGAWDLDGVSVESRRRGETSAGPAPLRVETDLSPTALKIRRFAGYGQNLSFSQARQMLAAIDTMGTDQEQARKMREQLERASLGRISTMGANFLTLIISMSFFLTREPGNMLRQSLKCAPIGMVSLIGGVLGTSATAPGVPTGLSVFIPVMVLLPVAIAMVSRVKS